MLEDGQQVGEDLARMLFVAQGVDDRYGRVSGQFGNLRVLEHPGDDAVDPARQVARYVRHGLACAQSDVGWPKVDR